MSNLTRRGNNAVSSVFGSVLILMLVITLASVLFISLYAYEEKAQESIDVEEERTLEKITLLSLSTENISGTEYLVAVSVNNTGTITTRIRAVYIDNIFVCDPTNPFLNPNDTYINPKESLWIIIPNNLKYEPLSQIQVATERGMKSIEYEWKLKSGSEAEPPSETQRFHFGPLLLDFEKFYYTENYGSYDPNSWKPGWSVEEGTTLVWNVTVTNIDDRDITINKYSGFTMVSNDGGAQKPWFIEPPNGMDTLFIPANTTAHLIYIWDRPRNTQGVSNQSVYQQNDRSKVFLTFFGIFHEHDGTTKPYGQTIPFEAVLVRDPLIGGISASPTTIAVGSTMTSTIAATEIRDINGIIAPGVTVNFQTTLGMLSSPTATTNSAGVAYVTLTPGTTTGQAVVTATWAGMSKSTTVTIALGTLTLTANPTAVAAGSTFSTITATVTINGNPLSGETVTFSVSGLGALSSSSGTTNAQGRVTTTFTPGSTAGTATITATTLTNTVTQSIDVHIINIITITPAIATSTAGTQRTYTATGSDGTGNSWDITNIVVWGIDSGADGSWNGPTYTSEKVGVWTVSATLGLINDTATLTVNHALATSITVTPPTATQTAGQSQTYAATAHDPYGNTWDVTSSVTWRIDQIGDGGSWMQSTGTYTSFKSGIWTVRAASGAASGTSSLTVNPAPMNNIVITPSSSIITAGNSQTFTVQAFDAYGNSLGDVTASTTWSIDVGAGGLWSGATYTSETAGLWVVTGTQGGMSDTSSLTVNHAGGASVTVAPSSVTLTAGQFQAFTATAADSSGNTWDVTGSVTWSVNTGAGGSWDGATYTSDNAGGWTVTATLGSVSGISSLSVNYASANAVTVNPLTATIIAGNSEAFGATAFDQYGNSWDVTNLAVWSINSGSGSYIWTDNSVQVTSAGTWSVTATYAGLGGTSSLTVNPAGATRFLVSAPSNVAANMAFSVSLTAEDQFGNVATGYTGTVHFTSSDIQAVLPADYLFVAGDLGTKNFTDVVLKTTGPQSITATDTLTGSITGSQSGIAVNP